MSEEAVFGLVATVTSGSNGDASREYGQHEK